MPLINKRIHQRILDKKKRLDSHRPLSHVLLARLRNELTIEYTYDSNAIEGSTLTLRETRLVIEEGITIGGRSIKEHLGARNHPGAISFIEGLVEAGRGIDEEAVLHLHELVMHGIEEDAGRYRASGVRIAGATFTPPPSIAMLPIVGSALAFAAMHIGPGQAAAPVPLFFLGLAGMAFFGTVVAVAC